eukprot:758086-Hanusia_phi.AAC.1
MPRVVLCPRHVVFDHACCCGSNLLEVVYSMVRTVRTKHICELIVTADVHADIFMTKIYLRDMHDGRYLMLHCPAILTCLRLFEELLLCSRDCGDVQLLIACDMNLMDIWGKFPSDMMHTSHRLVFVYLDCGLTGDSCGQPLFTHKPGYWFKSECSVQMNPFSDAHRHQALPRCLVRSSSPCDTACKSQVGVDTISWILSK